MIIYSQWNKIALSACNDTRYVLENGMHILAWELYKIDLIEEEIIEKIKIIKRIGGEK